MSRYEELSDVLKSLAHPARLQIVAGLKKNGCNVTEIQKKLGLPQSTISQHLKTLKQAGIIKGRREGKTVCYAITHDWAKVILALAEDP